MLKLGVWLEKLGEKFNFKNIINIHKVSVDRMSNVIENGK
jgi:hypothetical protein